MEKIKALEDAIEKKSLVGIYSVFYTIAHGDPNFSTGKFEETLAYVKSKNIAGFMQEFDGDELEPENKWDEDYWAYIASSLIDNFCMTRIEHLKQVGRKVYPVKVNQMPAQGMNVNHTQRVSQQPMNSGLGMNTPMNHGRMNSEQQQRRGYMQNGQNVHLHNQQQREKRDNSGFVNTMKDGIKKRANLVKDILNNRGGKQ